MSLEICETSTPQKFALKKSRFIRDRVQLIIEPGAVFSFIIISDELYSRQKKVYFPIFKNMIFSKTSGDYQQNNTPVIFKGSIIEDDERGMIYSVIQKNNEKENRKYGDYKKNLDKDISLIINGMNQEISNQKKFLKKGSLTRSQYSDNIKILVNSYTDIVMAKSDKEINLRSDDRSEINKFYGNMIAGLGNNNASKDIVSGPENPEIKDDIK